MKARGRFPTFRNEDTRKHSSLRTVSSTAACLLSSSTAACLLSPFSERLTPAPERAHLLCFPLRLMPRGLQGNAPSAVQRSGVCAKRARVGCGRRELEMACRRHQRPELGTFFRAVIFAPRESGGYAPLEAVLNTERPNLVELVGATPHSRPF